MENDPLDLFSVTCFAQFLPDIGKSLLLFPSANLGLKEKKLNIFIVYSPLDSPSVQFATLFYC